MNYRNLIVGDMRSIDKILRKLGFVYIMIRGKDFRFGNHEGSNTYVLDSQTLNYMNFKEDEKGDLLSLIMKIRKVSLYQSKRWLEECLGSSITLNSEYVNHFRYFDKAIDENTPQYQTLNVYNDKILNAYDNSYYNLFLNDNVGVLAHLVYNIRMDGETNRILIPIRNEIGELVGIIGRYNSLDVPIGVPKYFPLIPYPKSMILFGMWENRHWLKETIYVVEAEKAVLQALTLGYKNVVALGGSAISERQAFLIRSLNPKRVVLILDQGLKKDKYLEQAKKLISSNPFTKYLVGYLDSNNVEELPSKCNPFDLNKEDCQSILDNKIIYIGGL